MRLTFKTKDEKLKRDGLNTDKVSRDIRVRWRKMKLPTEGQRRMPKRCGKQRLGLPVGETCPS